MTGLLTREVRSELVRSRRRGVLLGWLGLTAVFTLLVNSIMYGVVADAPTSAAQGPGVAFPTLSELQSVDGLTAGVATAANMLGLVTLAFWAVLTGTDHSTGVLRLLASAQPRRWRLALGKALALSVWTLVASALALVLNVAVAPAAARAAGVDTSTWEAVTAADLGQVWVRLSACLLVWGVLGQLVATASRSAAVAVSLGAGWVLLVEGVVGAALEDVARWMPGATLTALAQGGTAEVSFTTALALGAGYASLGLVASALLLARRDVTD
ncbi:MAG: hypothetical protein AVDCRST_MAG07-249 [uncultured Frankineae bacterium]|uniref:ABC transporter integral membrane protein n=1 Tax=uncultured Frankineae bacterium TaxID=437475 RepID=A0A6J4KIL2_9ACTN|nr:MAG: hypothetical protein AVDCRST_MAG07-249 [uncultured Frankineae bacterium]